MGRLYNWSESPPNLTSWIRIPAMASPLGWTLQSSIVVSLPSSCPRSTTELLVLHRIGDHSDVPDIHAVGESRSCPFFTAQLRWWRTSTKSSPRITCPSKHHVSMLGSPNNVMGLPVPLLPTLSNRAPNPFSSPPSVPPTLSLAPPGGTCQSFDCRDSSPVDLHLVKRLSFPTLAWHWIEIAI